MADTAIEWTDAVWNPTTGCDKVSPGCGLPRWDGDEPHGQCYALTMAKRLKGMGQAKYQTDGDPRTSGPGFGVAVHEDALTIPLRWRKPRRVFVNSMSDLFHARVPREFVARVFAVMAATPEHTYQVLTKRPHRMDRMLGDGNVGTAGFFDEVEEAMAVFTHAAPRAWPLPNVWLGTSVEDERRAQERIGALQRTPAALRWLSCEPLLGPIDDVFNGGWALIDWVVVGGESGPGARPMNPDWARSLRDQCQAAGVPFFFKQWGEWLPYELDAQPPYWRGQDGQLVDGHMLPAELSDGEPVGGWWSPDLTEDAIYRRVGSKAAAGRQLDGRSWDEYPATPPRAGGR